MNELLPILCLETLGAKQIGVSMKHEAIDVRVAQQILWVGSEAYPLRMISRASTVKWEPRRGVLLWNYIKSLLIWLVVGGFAATAVASLAGSHALGGLVVLGVLVLLVFKTIRLVREMNFTFYELTVETAGASRRALVSPDGELVTELVLRITDAINNPQAEFSMRVDNFHIGDNIHQTGDRSVGKVNNW